MLYCCNFHSSVILSSYRNFHINSLAYLHCTCNNTDNYDDNKDAMKCHMSAAVGVTSLCSTGRIYVGNVDMSNAELIVFNGIYVQLSNSSVQLPMYKHESREQFLHVVLADRRPYWRIGIRRVGAQIDFVDYLGAPSVDDERVTSPDMTSRARRRPTASRGSRRSRSVRRRGGFRSASTGDALSLIHI